MIFGTNWSTLKIIPMMYGKARSQEAEGDKKRFQYCPSGQEILYLLALQGHSGRNPIDPLLQDNVLIPNNFFEYIYHIGCAINLHSITNSGLIAGGQNSSRDRQTVLFTAVNPIHKNQKIRKSLIWPNHVLHRTRKSGKVQDTVYWVDILLAQRKGLKLCRTTSNAIILHDTLPAYCIPKAIVMKSEEIIHQKVYVSPRPPPKISYEDNWKCDLDSGIAGSSKDIQRIEPKPNTQLSSTGRPVGGEKEEIEERTKFDRDTLNQGNAVPVGRYTSHESFSRNIWPCAHITPVAPRCRSVCLTKIIHAHVTTCLSVCCFLMLSSSFLSRLYFLSHCLPVLCPAHQLPCGRNRRGTKPLHSRTLRVLPRGDTQPSQSSNT